MSAEPAEAMSVPLGMLSFADALRRAGVGADTTRVTLALEALSHLNALNIDEVYWAGRLTLVADPEDMPRYDVVFQMHFLDRELEAPETAAVSTLRTVPLSADGSETADSESPQDDTPLLTSADDAEVLRHRDLAEIDAADRENVSRQIAALQPRTSPRRTMRRQVGGHGRIHRQQTVRAMLRAGGEPARLAHAQRRVKRRRLVLLLDVSGSMTPYSDSVLRFAHAAVRANPANVEVFTIGTRLTRVTRAMRLRDPLMALQTAAEVIPDWSGGTRIGESMQAFLELWGQRGTARRAVVVVFSDGWERGDASLLGEQMQRLARLTHRVLWVHPHRGKDGFAPLTGGMVAALPYIDDLVAGHTVAALAEVAEVIGHA
ncbi:vWA domain-containing protein [Jatrophihabitans sp. YIM 134969]